MIKEFLGKDFLLANETAAKLYYDYAEKMPIFDFHCHLSPQEIDEDKRFRDLTEVWLGGDHYKWRLLREAGVDEEYITGGKDSYEKFLRFAEVLPYCIGNPIHQWAHLELRRYFGINTVLTPDTAAEIFNAANEKLKTLTARKMMQMMNVKAVFTTDDPSDTLNHHINIAKDKSFGVAVKPTFRPDKYVNISLDTFLPWIKRLENVTGKKVGTLNALTTALKERIEFFHSVGCVCSDHALDVVEFAEPDEKVASTAFNKALKNESLSQNEIAAYKTYILNYVGRQYARLGWVQQYHIGALRNTNTRLKTRLGADIGGDAVNDGLVAQNLAKLLDSLDVTNELPKTVLYCLNPRDNEVLSVMMNCFAGGEKGKVQYGSAWWFNDQRDGMERQLEALAQTGMLSAFVGMLTDSRSFLSYPRHEYFRRILCSKLGAWMEEGAYPYDIKFVGKIVEDICYNNAVNYFKAK